MINRAELKNFGPIKELDWQNLGKINLIIGNNGCGKSFLLKALYSAVRTLEEYKRGANPESINDILFGKLFWTFQPDKKIGDLVNKKANSLSVELTFDNSLFRYEFGKDTTKLISAIVDHVAPIASNSIYLPAKEVLSLLDIITQSRDRDKSLGFDDTYLDLARALKQSTKQGKKLPEFAESRKELENILGGKIEYDESSNIWKFKNKDNHKFSIGNTAEGIKKIAILDTLLGNKYLSKESIIFVDELESALHPAAISKLIDIVAKLSSRGIQFFIASHSYFVIKKLFLIAQEQQMSIPVLSYQNNEWVQSDLKKHLPDNPIIDESIKLYEQQLDMD